jgi:hypothetical protein
MSVSVWRLAAWDGFSVRVEVWEIGRAEVPAVWTCDCVHVTWMIHADLNFRSSTTSGCCTISYMTPSLIPVWILVTCLTVQLLCPSSSRPCIDTLVVHMLPISYKMCVCFFQAIGVLVALLISSSLNLPYIRHSLVVLTCSL